MRVAIIGAHTTTVRSVIKYIPKNTEVIIFRDWLYRVNRENDEMNKKDFTHYDEAIEQCDQTIMFSEVDTEDSLHIKNTCEELNKKLTIFPRQERCKLK